MLAPQDNNGSLPMCLAYNDEIFPSKQRVEVLSCGGCRRESKPKVGTSSQDVLVDVGRNSAKGTAWQCWLLNQL